MLDSKLEIFCKKNFNDEKKIISQFMDYKKLLINENTKMNLIGKSTIDNFDQRHLLDCIQIVKHMPDRKKNVMDIGTGAGLPGVLLSIIGFKNLHLVEKSPKKSAFLEKCKLRLGLNFNIHNNSISDISGINVDYITARAFAPIEKIISLTKKIINKRTNYILLKGKSYLLELENLNTNNYNWKIYPSITSDESKIIVVMGK